MSRRATLLFVGIAASALLTTGLSFLAYPVAAQLGKHPAEKIIFITQLNEDDRRLLSAQGIVPTPKLDVPPFQHRNEENRRFGLAVASLPRPRDVEVIRVPIPLAISIIAAAIAAGLFWYIYKARPKLLRLLESGSSLAQDGWIFFSIIALVCSVPVLFALLQAYPQHAKRAYKIAVAFFITGASGIYVCWRQHEYPSLGRRFEFIVTTNVASDVVAHYLADE